MPDPDHTLDARLRDVAVPSSLPARLASAAVFDDPALDRIVNDVSLPAGLMERLRTARSVAGPANRRWSTLDLERPGVASGSAGGRRPSWPRARRVASTVGREALTVGCALACGWLFFTAGAGLSSRLAGSPRGERPHLGRSGESQPEHATPRTPPRIREVPSATTAASQPPSGVTPPPPATTVDDAPTARTLDRSLATRPDPATPPQIRGAAVGLPAPPSAIVGSTPVMPIAPRRSRFVPRVPGFDLGFEMSHGESPFVDPSAAGLATDRPPLVLATDSFDRLLHAPRRSDWRSLKTEHVLAALDDGRVDGPPAESPPANELRLDVHGVRSLRTVRGAPTILVEVAVAAGAVAAGPARSTVMVLDRSAGSARPVWTALCRAVAAAGRSMAAEDRLSVIVAGPMPRLAIRMGDPAAIRRVAAELESLPPTDVADLDAAISLAAEEAADAGARLLVACRAETADRARGEAAEALIAWRRDRAAGEDAGTDPRRDAAPDFVLIDPLPSAPSGPTALGRTPSDSQSIRRAVLHHLFGDAANVARKLRLEVSFDPRHVAAYRLIGHRQAAVDSLARAPVMAIDLAAGETARVVYEVVPRGGPVTGMVTAAATWQSAADGSTRRVRGEFDARADDLDTALASPHGCTLLLATILGESASGSPHADPRAVPKALSVARRCRDRGDLPGAGAVVAECLEKLASEGRRSP